MTLQKKPERDPLPVPKPAPLRDLKWEMHDDLLAAMRARCPRRRTGWAEHEPLTFAIVKLENVRQEWHVVVPFTDLRNEAAWWIRTFDQQRTNEPDGVLIICPAQ